MMPQRIFDHLSEDVGIHHEFIVVFSDSGLLQKLGQLICSIEPAHRSVDEAISRNRKSVFEASGETLNVGQLRRIRALAILVKLAVQANKSVNDPRDNGLSELACYSMIRLVQVRSEVCGILKRDLIIGQPDTVEMNHGMRVSDRIVAKSEQRCGCTRRITDGARNDTCGFVISISGTQCAENDFQTTHASSGTVDKDRYRFAGVVTPQANDVRY
jgi:hypothetical protein